MSVFIDVNTADTVDTAGELKHLPRDIHREILIHMDMRTIGRVAQLNTYWRQIADPTSRTTNLDKARRMRILALRRYNVTEDLLKYFNDTELSSLIAHPNITFDIIKRYPDIGWQWEYITTNPNITFEMLLELIDIYKIPLSTPFVINKQSAVTMHELIESRRDLQAKLHDSIATIEDYLNGYCQYNIPQNFQMMGIITENDILQCKKIAWRYEWFVRNEHLSVEFLFNYRVQNAHLMNHAQFIDSEISRFCKDPIYGPKYAQLVIDSINNGSLGLDIELIQICSLLFPIATLLQNPPVCNWFWICARNDFTTGTTSFDTIMEHFDLTRIWLMRNDVIKMPYDFTAEHPWMRYIKLRFEEKLTIDVILANPSIPWIWEKLAECRTIAVDDLLNIAEVSNNYMTFVSKRPDLTRDIVIKHVNLQWYWYWVHKTLTRDATE